MSLEQALVDNTAALKAFMATFAGASISADKPAAGKKTKAEKTETPAGTVATNPVTTTVVTGPSLKLVTDTVLDFAATEGKTAKEILKSFGVSRITELKAETYPKVLEAVAAAKAKIAADLLAGNDDPESLV
jgi:hypothetical protein